MRKKAKTLTENAVGFLFALGSHQSLHLNKRFHGFLLSPTSYFLPHTIYPLLDELSELAT